MRTFFQILFLSCLIPLGAIAQSTAIKFDEFTSADAAAYIFDDEISFKERLDRFIRQLRLESRNTKVYLVHYQARVSQRSAYSPSERRANRAEWEITSNTKVGYENVVIIDGGLRDSDTLEFWIGRRNAPPPKLTPAYAASEAVVCPTIWLNEQAFHLDESEPARFSAALEPTMNTEFTWKVMPGRILNGQGTSNITVDVKGLNKLSVSVAVPGVPNECVRSRTRVFGVGRRPLLRDEFTGINESELRGRLDSFLAEVSEHPDFKGYMIMYGRRSRPQSLDAYARLVSNHFAFRRFPTGRIDIVKGGYHDEGGMELWLLPPGVPPPAARPTVDSSFVRLRRATRSARK